MSARAHEGQAPRKREKKGKKKHWSLYVEGLLLEKEGRGAGMAERKKRRKRPSLLRALLLEKRKGKP